MDLGGMFVEMFVMIDFGLNISLLFKNVVEWLGIVGIVIYFIMNLVGKEKRFEILEIIEIIVVLSIEEDIIKILEVYMIKRFCSVVKMILKGVIEYFFYFKLVVNKLYLFGGIIDFLIGIDFVDVFVDIYILFGELGELIVKCNCFGWYVLG